MSAIIKVENLGKKYTIRHEHPEPYTALRDVITLKAKKLFSFPKHLRSTTISTDYEDFWALKEINFEIKQGDRVGIIGRNGAGKSTLLKVLSRITEPSTGRIELNGRVASLLEVGTGFHPELTGRENIYLNGAILGMSRFEIRKKFDEIVDFSGVEKFLDTPVKRYSSGMYVRLAFAVAAHLEPEILVVDEVLAVGDAEFQKKCLGKMEEVSKNEGRTVLFVSHNISAMTGLCNKGFLLQKGMLSHIGTIQDSVLQYLNQYTKTTRKITYSLDNAPEENDIKFIFAEVRQITTIRETEHFEIGDAVELEFIFQNKRRQHRALDITYHLYDELGNLVFVGSTCFNNKTSRNYTEGEMKFVCRIPSGLMNEGRYNIQRLLIVQDRGTIIFSQKDVLQFEIIPKQEENWGWMGNKEGIVFPTLEWFY